MQKVFQFEVLSRIILITKDLCDGSKTNNIKCVVTTPAEHNAIFDTIFVLGVF